MDIIRRDLSYALRVLLKSPAFSLVAIVSIGLGIGVNTAIFSLVNALLFRPLPAVSEPDRLVWFTGSSSYPNYEDYLEQNDVFTGMLASAGKSEFSLGGDGRPELVTGEFVTASYFSVLGVTTAIGRGFSPEQDRQPNGQVVVISHNLWQNRFGSNPDIIGKPISLNGLNFSVVGVAAKSFIGTEVGIDRELWVPLQMFTQLNPRPTDSNDDPARDRLVSRDTHWLNVVARLKPGVSREQAEAAMTTIADRVATANGDRKADERLRSVRLLPVAGGLDPRDRREAVPVSGLLMAVVGIVLLIACANVASLLLSRASLRQREVAIRQAMGATRRRLIRQLMTESMLLALIGGVAGLMLGLWTVDLLKALSSATPIAAIDISLDYRVLGFSLLISIITGLLFGLVPALQASRPDLVPALKNESLTFGRHRRSRLRSAFVIVQVTLSFVLLIGSGLFVRSLQNAQAIDPGFDSTRGLTVPLDLGLLRLDKQKGQEFYRQLTDSVRALPGVEQVSLVRFVPLGFSYAQREVEIEGVDAGLDAGFNIIGDDYFRTMGIPLLRGREFVADDTTGGVIINETLASEAWPGEDAIGKRVSLNGKTGPFEEIIGVVKDGKYATLGETSRPFIYQRLRQNYEAKMTLIVRTTSAPLDVADAIRAQVYGLNPNLPVATVQTLASQVSLSLYPARLTAGLLGVFGLLALALAGVGIYGVVAYSVSNRTNEFGIRMALGADPGDLLSLVLKEGLVIVSIGLGLGLVLAFIVGSVVSSFLYGLSPADPLTFAAISLLLVGVALGACFVPARRASKLDPMIALRHE
ncbi:MAG TPA: ABC transporter permease [Blastocatellia bacterium]|nr:ABC transporter permease [Blastocatellia bacterium]